MRHMHLAFLTLAALLAPGSIYAQAQLTARLSGAQEIPVVATAAKGTAAFTLTNGGLQFFVTVEGLSGAIAQAHIHRGAQGVNGIVVRDIGDSFHGNTARGLWTSTDAQPLTPTLIADLLDGNLYVNIHTAANVGGEIRGQISLSAGTQFTANLTGTQENPALAVGGKGSGMFKLTDQGLTFRITATGLTGAMNGAHIHSGAIGVNGPVAIDLLPFFTGTTGVGTVTLTPAQRKSLLAGGMYANLHTAANAGGEIRGQLVLAGGFGFSARLTGAAEVPPVTPAGTGTASCTLTPAGLLIQLTTTALTSAITDVHVHRGAVGVDGPVVRALTPDFVSSTSLVALWRSDDAEPLTPSLIADLLAGNLYLNVHTTTNGGGETRGQILLNQPSGTPTTTFTAQLTGAQEEPPLAVTGLGTGTFRLTAAGLAFDVTVDGLTGPITGAHFHDGEIGASGGVVRDILASFGGGRTASGVWTSADAQPLTPALVTKLLQGKLYVNVYTAANGGGEIRGQVLPASGADLFARITGREEDPFSVATGLGTASCTLGPDGLAFSITVDGLTGALTAAHIHNGAPGVAGPVIRTLSEFSGNHAEGVWKPSDAQSLTPAFVTDLLKGNLYINTHTVANPTGEIRGQLRLGGGIGRVASLTGGAEVPPVSTLGNGVASLTLTDQGLVFRVSANDLQGALSQAHFHQAPFGANGAVVRDIFPEFAALTGDGVWKPTDASPLTAALMGSVVKDEVYMNLHTSAFGSGEVRGQVASRSLTAVDPTRAPLASLGLANVPNPFGERTVFSFYLPEDGWIELAVYDLGGRKVSTVARGGYSAGAHHQPFDARPLPTGIYLYRLDAGPLHESGKMLVMH